MTRKLYLDQNYLSGIAKRKPGFLQLEPVLRAALSRGAVIVLESAVHEIESLPRPDLRLLELLRELSGGHRLPDRPGRPAQQVRQRMSWTIEHELPVRRSRASDAADLEALAGALVHCDLVTCDAFMADVIRRTRLDLRHRCELFTGRQADVARLREELGRTRAP
ncbi:MAG: hypothetical protein ACTHQQ_06850 [Solirubrobacteraceae bacterium]